MYSGFRQEGIVPQHRTTPAARPLVVATLAALTMALACGHAPPVTGNRAPDAPIDPDYPEQNCAINNTVDCMPSSAGP